MGENTLDESKYKLATVASRQVIELYWMFQNQIIEQLVRQGHNVSGKNFRVNDRGVSAFCHETKRNKMFLYVNFYSTEFTANYFTGDYTFDGLLKGNFNNNHAGKNKGSVPFHISNPSLVPKAVEYACKAFKIKSGLAVEPHRHEPEMTDDDLETEFGPASPEGRRVQRTHIIIERHRGVVAAAKKHWTKADPDLKCEVCHFSFVTNYGEHGEGFIEAHHREPLANLRPGETRTPAILDFAPVCSNCHRMLHRLGGMSIEELRGLLE